MTAAQLTYPLIALSEALTLIHTRGCRQAQNGPALRLWLQVQLAIFCILEPASFLSASIYGRYFFVCTIFSAAADLMVLYSLFYCLEDGFQAFGSVRAWGATALLCGLLFCFSAELPLPFKAHGIEIAWFTVAQAFTYIRILALIALSFYGWFRASSWPGNLWWTWLAMATFGVTDAVVTRIQILNSDTNMLELVTSAAAFLQLLGWWRALAYSPKPLTQFELEAANSISINR